MSDMLLWRIFCVTNNKYEYIWDTAAPTTCPVSAGHTVKANSANDLTVVNIYRSLDNTESPYSLTQYNFYRCDTTSGNIVFNLLYNDNFNKDRVIVIQKISSSNTVTINPQATKTINGSASLTLTTNKQYVNLVSSGNGNWVTINSEDIDIEDFLTFDDRSVSLIANGSKGGLLVNNSKDLSYLNVGTNKQILTADSVQPLGVKWASLTSLGIGGNYIHIGDTCPAINTSNTYRVLFRIIFPGSNVFNLGTIYVLVTDDDDDNSPDSDGPEGGCLRIVNTSNNTIMKTVLNIPENDHIETLTSLSNIPTTPCIIEVQGKHIGVYSVLLAP